MKRQLVLGLAAAALIAALTPSGAQAASDITCTAQADGARVVAGEDAAYGSAVCVSTSDKAYTLTMTLSIQSLHDGVWVNVGCSASRSGTVVQGVGVIAPFTVTCNYGANSTYLDEYHRAHVVLTNSVDGVTRSFDSTTWIG